MVLTLLEAGIANYHLQSTAISTFPWNPPILWVGRQGRTPPKSSSDQPKTRPGLPGLAQGPDTHTSTAQLHSSSSSLPAQTPSYGSLSMEEGRGWHVTKNLSKAKAQARKSNQASHT